MKNNQTKKTTVFRLILQVFLMAMLVGAVAILVAFMFFFLHGIDASYQVGRIAGWVILALTAFRVIHWVAEKKFGVAEE